MSMCKVRIIGYSLIHSDTRILLYKKARCEMDEKQETERRRLREKLVMAGASNQRTYQCLFSAEDWGGEEQTEKIETGYRVGEELQRNIGAVVEEVGEKKKRKRTGLF